MSSFLKNIDRALELLKDKEIFNDLGKSYTDAFEKDLQELKKCFLDGTLETFLDPFEDGKIGYFKGPTGMNDTYSEAHKLFQITKELWRSLWLYKYRDGKLN